MLENVKIGKKLIGGFILTIIIMLIIAGTGFIFISNLAVKSDEMYNDRLIPLQEIGTVVESFTQFRGDVYKAMLVPAERDVSLSSAEAVLKKIEDQIGIIDKLNLSVGEKIIQCLHCGNL